MKVGVLDSWALKPSCDFLWCAPRKPHFFCRILLEKAFFCTKMQCRKLHFFFCRKMHFSAGKPIFLCASLRGVKNRVRKICPKFSCIKFFQIQECPNPKSRDIPATPCLKQQQKATCINFCPGYPDVWVPDVPGMSRPKTLCFGCFFFGPE